jgi:hypothetical protein
VTLYHRNLGLAPKATNQPEALSCCASAGTATIKRVNTLACAFLHITDPFLMLSHLLGHEARSMQLRCQLKVRLGKGSSFLINDRTNSGSVPVQRRSRYIRSNFAPPHKHKGVRRLHEALCRKNVASRPRHSSADRVRAKALRYFKVSPAGRQARAAQTPADRYHQRRCSRTGPPS